MKQQDKWQKKAKLHGYLARSAYKLLQLNNKHNIIKNNDRILDLGCSPGSWVQVALKLNASKIIGIDIKKPKIKDKRFKFIKSDINKLNIKNLEKFDVIISDLAPSTSGIKELDESKSLELTEKAFELSKELLKQNGNFLAKVFQGSESNKLINQIKKEFKFYKIAKPVASKKRSKEIYIVAKGYLK
jgi:23S rRNA (uridine2552-2'-O)-methyltransferase